VRDLVIRGGTLVTMDPRRRVLRGDLLVRGGKIARIGKVPGPDRGRRVIDATDKAVLPGFVQTHVHLCQALLRGTADDLPLLEWLKKRIWPGEAAHDEKSLAASARLGLCELLRSGTTTIQDMGTVHHQDVIFEALRDSGIRAHAGKAMMDAGSGVPPRLKERTRDSLRESEALCSRWHGAEKGRLRYAFAPRFVLSCSYRLLAEVGPLARERGARIHTHSSEQKPELRVVRRRFGRDNVEALAEFGLVGEDVGLAHCVHVSRREIRLLAETGTRVLHCPSANLKLGSGVAPVPEMLAAGVPVSLGADGSPCNNNLDAFVEMRHAALVQKPRLGPQALPAAEVLALATIEGARALGREHEIGSLERGKAADLLVLDLQRAHNLGGEPYGAIVYSSGRDDVVHVLVDGRPLLFDRRLTSLDEALAVSEARSQRRRLLRRM